MKNIVLTEELTAAHDQCPITMIADHHMENLLPVSGLPFPVSCFNDAMVTAKTHHTEQKLILGGKTIIHGVAFCCPVQVHFRLCHSGRRSGAWLLGHERSSERLSHGWLLFWWRWWWVHWLSLYRGGHLCGVCGLALKKYKTSSVLYSN